MEQSAGTAAGTALAYLGEDFRELRRYCTGEWYGEAERWDGRHLAFRLCASGKSAEAVLGTLAQRKKEAVTP